MLPVAAVAAILLAIFCCYHVVRTGRDTSWLYLILIFQPLGSVIYLVSVILPEVIVGHGFRVKAAALKVIDPNRAYREARDAVEESPTVYNRMTLAAAAAELGRFDEAAHIYALCLDGIHSDDPVLLHRYAGCLIELGQFQTALKVLGDLADLGDAGRTPQAALLMARAHEGLGDFAAAEPAYAWAAERLTDVEGLARYIAFLSARGRTSAARDQLVLLEKRVARTPKAFRRDAASWKAYAADTLKSVGPSTG